MMVMRNFKKIKESLPDVLHLAMFYNDGTIFQTTFTAPVNIPKLGDSLSKILESYRNTIELSCSDACIDANKEKYSKIIYQSKELIIIILKLGEDSNIALFFPGKVGDQINLNRVRAYLDKLEEIIDMDFKEIEEIHQE